MALSAVPFILGINANTSSPTPTPAPAPAGYDIFVSAGQSNESNGATFDATLDGTALDLTKIYTQRTGYPGGAVPALSSAGTGDPLYYTADGGTNGNIGHIVHFLADATVGYNATSLLSPRKVVIVPAAKGGSPVSVSNFATWGVFSGTVGGLASDMQAAINAALALTGTNSFKAMHWTQGEAEYQAYGAARQLAVTNKFRSYLTSFFEYFRANNPGVPILIYRLSKYSIDAGAANYALNGVEVDNIIKSMPNVFPYMALVDSQTPVELGTSDIHYTAAEQRILATRAQAAYATALAATTTPVTWDANFYPTTALNYAAGFALSNGNLDLSGDGNSGWKVIKATGPRTAGKLYFEIKAQAVANASNIGIIGISNDYIEGWDMNLGGGSSSLGTFYDGVTGKGAGVWGNNGAQVKNYTVVNTATFTATAVNDVYGFAVDFATGKAWVHKNGTYASSGDPAAGTNAWISGIAGRTFIAASIFTGATNTWRLNAGASAFTYTAPSGFSAWKDGTP